MDAYREFHPDVNRYTWRKHNPIKQSRLDFFLISETLLVNTSNADILPSYRSDHSPVSLHFKFDEFKHGKGLWKFNNSLLEDLEYIQLIKKTIQDIKDQYALFVYDRENLNTISDNDIQFTINDQLFFETLLLEIRAKQFHIQVIKKEKKMKKKKSEQWNLWIREIVRR